MLYKENYITSFIIWHKHFVYKRTTKGNFEKFRNFTCAMAYYTQKVADSISATHLNTQMLNSGIRYKFGDQVEY